MAINSVEVTNNPYGDPWIWVIRDRSTDQVVGMVIPSGSRFRAIDHETHRDASGVDHMQAVLNLYDKLGMSVLVSVAPDLTETGIALVNARVQRDPNKPLDFNGRVGYPPSATERQEDEPLDFNSL
jgi:hypothetical protein